MQQRFISKTQENLHKSQGCAEQGKPKFSCTSQHCCTPKSYPTIAQAISSLLNSESDADVMFKVYSPNLLETQKTSTFPPKSLSPLSPFSIPLTTPPSPFGSQLSQNLEDKDVKNDECLIRNRKCEEEEEVPNDDMSEDTDQIEESDIKIGCSSEKKKNTISSDEERVNSKFYAHKLILAIRSPVFKSMFYNSGGMRESIYFQEEPEEDLCQDSQINGFAKGKLNTLDKARGITVIEENDLDASSISEMLKYIYTDRVHLTPENIIGTLFAAKKYQIEGLIHLCVEKIESEYMDPETVCSILIQAYHLDESKLLERCRSFVLNKFEKIWEEEKKKMSISPKEDFSPDPHATTCFDSDRQCMTDFPEEVTISLIQSEDLRISQEYQVFEFCLEWSKKQLLREKIACIGSSDDEEIRISEKELRNKMEGLLPWIRFPFIPQRIFALKVVPTSILRQEEVVELLTFFATDGQTTTKFIKSPRKHQGRVSNIDITWDVKSVTLPVAFRSSTAQTLPMFQSFQFDKTVRKVLYDDVMAIVRAHQPLTITNQNPRGYYTWIFIIDQADDMERGYATVLNVGIASAAHKYQTFSSLSGPKAWAVKDEQLRTGDRVQVELLLQERTVHFYRIESANNSQEPEIRVLLASYRGVVDDVVYPAVAMRGIGSQVTVE